MRFRGTGYRAHDPRWSFAPTSGEGAAIHGGRFNPKGVPALYLALDPMTAIKEANQGLARKIEPCVLCSYEIDCEDIVDLANAEARAANGTSPDELAAGWFGFLAEGREPPQWALARRLIKLGAAGIRVQSYAPGAHAGDRNLVLWRWGDAPPHRIEVFDPREKLPKNPRSWE